MKRFFFPKRVRLSKNSDFLYLLKAGKSIETPYFVLLYSKNQFSYSRIGVSIKRKFGNAVKRNRLKRWVKEIFRQYSRVLAGNFDLMILTRKKLSLKFEEMKFGNITQQLLELFESVRKSTCDSDDLDDKNISK